MIGKQDILEHAREWQLRPEVVEKDYVLGWLLAAIAQHGETSEHWVLKGGTCVKKCFFETYRFSEDLDFSLLPEAAYSEADLREVLFDLTQHEPVIDEPVLRRVLHPYPDEIPAEVLVQTYSIEELIAEKARALYERSRPRDLYDVVYILGDDSHGIELSHARDVFIEKCEAKQLSPPSSREILDLVERADEMRTEWANMLAHQLPQLPPLDGMLARLAAALSWIDRIPVAAAAPPSLPVGTQETIVAPDSARLWRSGIPLETIRFAGSNHLLVRFVYNGKTRTLEPYSLRRSSRGNLLLYGWEVESAQIKAFDVSRIAQLSTTDRTFTPRYRVEFSPGASIESSILAAAPGARRSLRRASRVGRRVGPTYVYVCPVCHREFRHQRRDSTLRRHKTSEGGWYCSGRLGYLGRTE